MDRGPAVDGLRHEPAFKIGTHYGPIVASRLGGRSHQHITATGDTVKRVEPSDGKWRPQKSVRLALSDTLRIEAERSGARLKVGSLAGPGRKREIRGRSGSLVVWLWRNDQATEIGFAARRPRK